MFSVAVNSALHYVTALSLTPFRGRPCQRAARPDLHTHRLHALPQRPSQAAQAKDRMVVGRNRLSAGACRRGSRHAEHHVFRMASHRARAQCARAVWPRLRPSLSHSPRPESRSSDLHCFFDCSVQVSCGPLLTAVFKWVNCGCSFTAAFKWVVGVHLLQCLSGLWVFAYCSV